MWHGAMLPSAFGKRAKRVVDPPAAALAAPNRWQSEIPLTETKVSGGYAIFWTGPVLPVDEQGNVLARCEARQTALRQYRRCGKHTARQTLRPVGAIAGDRAVPMRFPAVQAARHGSAASTPIRRSERSICRPRSSCRFW